MKSIILAAIMLMSIPVHAQIGQIGIGFGAGAMTGKNYVITGGELVSITPYLIYKDVYEWKRDNSPAAKFFIHYNTNKGPVFSVGIISAFSGTSPAFANFTAGWQFGGIKADEDECSFDNNKLFGIQPYVGYAYRMNNIDRKDMGACFIKGVEIQRWFEARGKADKFCLWIAGEYAYKHVSVTFGFTGYIKRN